jgi:hypothetical protein
MTKDGARRLTAVTLAQMTAAHEATEDHVLEGLALRKIQASMPQKPCKSSHSGDCAAGYFRVQNNGNQKLRKRMHGGYL